MAGGIFGDSLVHPHEVLVEQASPARCASPVAHSGVVLRSPVFLAQLDLQFVLVGSGAVAGVVNPYTSNGSLERRIAVHNLLDASVVSTVWYNYLVGKSERQTESERHRDGERERERERARERERVDLGLSEASRVHGCPKLHSPLWRSVTSFIPVAHVINWTDVPLFGALHR